MEGTVADTGIRKGYSLGNPVHYCYGSVQVGRSPNPNLALASPNCRDRWKCKEIIAMNGRAREALPDARRSQTHTGTCTLTPANIMSLMAGQVHVSCVNRNLQDTCPCTVAS